MLGRAPPTGHDSGARQPSGEVQEMERFSALALLKRGLSGQRGWTPQWRRPEKPKKGYDAVIVGGGGHGLGAAYYLAEEHGLTNIAVVEKGWIGGGNTGRNTTNSSGNNYSRPTNNRPAFNNSNYSPMRSSSPSNFGGGGMGGGGGASRGGGISRPGR